MNINKQLLEAANLNPTKNSRQEYIFTLCEYIEKNELTLPLYQRDVSWTLAKCVELLNYQLLSKSPISAISINIIYRKRICSAASIICRKRIAFRICKRSNVGCGWTTKIDNKL